MKWASLLILGVVIGALRAHASGYAWPDILELGGLAVVMYGLFVLIVVIDRVRGGS